MNTLDFITEELEKLIVDEFRKLGYDITWIAEENPHLDDMSIFKIAQKENRILLTNDKDFGEIVFRQKLVSSGIILFRIKGQDTREKIKLLRKVLNFHKVRISKHFVVITKVTHASGLSVKYHKQDARDTIMILKAALTQ